MKSHCHHDRLLLYLGNQPADTSGPRCRDFELKLEHVMKKLFCQRTTAVFIGFLTAMVVIIVASGCGTGSATAAHQATTGTVATTGTSPAVTATAPAAPAGIILDDNLRSATGVPDAADMKVLIDLQKHVPYPVMVPTELPGGLQLDPDLVGYEASSSPDDPAGFYSYRYYEPGNQARMITFNQSISNSQPLSGYYLTETNIGGTDFQVYWHQTRVYLPNGAPVRVPEVGKAETFVVVWKGSYKDASGKQQDLYYSMTTGTWTGWEWQDIKAILESIQPLSAVGS